MSVLIDASTFIKNKFFIQSATYLLIIKRQIFLYNLDING